LEEHAYREQFRLEDAHWWFVGRRAVLWSLLSRAGLPEHVRILDAGCGTGRNLREFAVLGAAQGVDPSAEAIEYARCRGVHGITEAGLEQLPFADASFDLILATDVLEHVEREADALGELRRVAAPGGRLLITAPAYRWLWSQHDDVHHHFRRYTMRSLRRTVRASGWEPIVRSYFNTLLLPPIALVRVLARADAPANGRADLELTPGPLNRLLEQPMRLEAALIARGVRLPAGVSVAMVCRRA
jgi:SAM-dependent methyltransferase